MHQAHTPRYFPDDPPQSPHTPDSGARVLHGCPAPPHKISECDVPGYNGISGVGRLVWPLLCGIRNRLPFGLPVLAFHGRRRQGRNYVGQYELSATARSWSRHASSFCVRRNFIVWLFQHIVVSGLLTFSHNLELLFEPHDVLCVMIFAPESLAEKRKQERH